MFSSKRSKITFGACTLIVGTALLQLPAQALVGGKYALTKWVNKYQEDIVGVGCNMQHTRINAPDWWIPGCGVGEVMWGASTKTFSDGTRPWIEVGWSDGQLVSNWTAGHCFYWAQSDDNASYHDVRIWDDNDPDMSRRWYIIRKVIGTNEWEVIISDTNSQNYYLVGKATNVAGPLRGSDHGLEVSSSDSKAVFNNSHASVYISGIQSLINGSGWWSNDDVYFNVGKTNTDPSHYAVETNQWDTTWNYAIF